MGYVIGVVSQKGGVGKSTVARLLATEFARTGPETETETDEEGGESWRVKIADLDVSQGTSFHWMRRRAGNGIAPEIRVEAYARVEQAVRDAADFHVMILDGAPQSSRDTLKVAQASDLVVIPTRTSLDDLEPAVRLAHELKGKGVPASRLCFGLNATGDSEAETQEARAYLTHTGYRVAAGSLPERTGYRRAGDLGLAVSETAYPSLNARARAFAAGLMATLGREEDASADAAADLAA